MRQHKKKQLPIPASEQQHMCPNHRRHPQTISRPNARQNACSQQTCCANVQAHPQEPSQRRRTQPIELHIRAMPHQLETLGHVEDLGVGNGPHDRVRGHGADQSINSIASPVYVLTDI